MRCLVGKAYAPLADTSLTAATTHVMSAGAASRTPSRAYSPQAKVPARGKSLAVPLRRSVASRPRTKPATTWFKICSFPDGVRTKSAHRPTLSEQARFVPPQEASPLRKRRCVALNATSLRTLRPKPLPSSSVRRQRHFPRGLRRPDPEWLAPLSRDATPWYGPFGQLLLPKHLLPTGSNKIHSWSKSCSVETNQSSEESSCFFDRCQSRNK